jgi:hypothetical protein
MERLAVKGVVAIDFARWLRLNPLVGGLTMLIFLAFVLALPLAGCLTPQERMAEVKARNDVMDDQTCQSYGAKPGTDIYIQCRMNRQQNRDAADNAAVSSPVIVNNVSTPSPSYPTLQPIINPGPRCTSRGC